MRTISAELTPPDFGSFTKVTPCTCANEVSRHPLGGRAELHPYLLLVERLLNLVQLALLVQDQDYVACGPEEIHQANHIQSPPFSRTFEVALELEQLGRGQHRRVDDAATDAGSCVAARLAVKNLTHARTQQVVGLAVLLDLRVAKVPHLR